MNHLFKRITHFPAKIYLFCIKTYAMIRFLTLSQQLIDHIHMCTCAYHRDSTYTANAFHIRNPAAIFKSLLPLLNNKADISIYMLLLK